MSALITRTHWAYALWDCICWLLAVAFAVAVYYRFELSGVQWVPVVVYALVACITQFVVGSVTKVYQGRYRHASFDESMGMGVTWLVVAVLTGFIYLTLPRLMDGLFREGFPYALIALAPLAVPVLSLAPRWARRASHMRSQRTAEGSPALIYGAGDSGSQVARLLRIDSEAPYSAVGFLDDSPAKRHLVLEGLRVLGTGEDMVEVARERGVEAVILAITAAPPALIAKTEERLRAEGIALKIVPPAREVLGGLHASDLRDINVADLLGRRQIRTDVRSVSSYLKGKRVLVTGGGGSIGSELVRQIHAFEPAELVILDRDEGGLHATQLKVYGQALLDTPDIALVSIRDKGALETIFAQHKPQVVFHAAALKHLPLLEQYPDEGWKTNVEGTANVLECASRYGVETFVNISTDKAADPMSVLGKTKRCAEHLTAWYGKTEAGRYISVRFGNVLGSRGSMLQTFTQQIEKGGPVTVTHPDVTRFFMTIPEACELVIQAGGIGDDGEVLVLDMGEPVRILDVAKHLISRSGRKVKIVFTGLRPGEKMHEVLFNHGDEVRSRAHPLISHVTVPPVAPKRIEPDYRVSIYPSHHAKSRALPTSKVYS